MRHLSIVVPLILVLGQSGCPSKSSSSSSSPQSSSASSSSATSKSDSSAEDKTTILGTWVAVDGEYQGGPMDKKELKKYQWTFTADGVTYMTLGPKIEGKYKLDPSASPRTFDFKGSEPITGIYELSGDTLKVCFAATERPTAFKTAGTTQDTLMIVFKKTK